MQFQGDINKLKDQLNEKEQVIDELTSNLYRKGEQNRKLAETVTSFKNQLIQD